MQMRVSFAVYGGIVLGLSAFCGRSVGADFSLMGSADGIVRSFAGNANFTQLVASPTSLSIRKFDAPSTGIPDDERSIVEFNAAALSGLSVSNASVDLNVIGFTSGSQSIDIHGYVGDGIVNLIDATAPSVLLGSFTASSLGPVSVPLSAANLTGLVTTGGIVGLRLQGPSEPVNVQLDAIQGLFGGPPTLQIDVVPEPSTALLLVGFASMAVCVRRRKHKR